MRLSLLFQLKRFYSVAILFTSLFVVGFSANAQCYEDFYVYQVSPYGQLCSPQYVTLRAEYDSYGSYVSGEFRWYSSDTDPNPVQTNYIASDFGQLTADYTVYANNGTTVWVSFYNYNTGCESYRQPYTFYISSPPNVYQDYAKKCGYEPAKVQVSSNLDDPSNQSPYNYVQLPIKAVSSITSGNGIGGTDITSFNYEDLIVHRTGKGMLGFKKTIAKNATSGITSITENSINTQFAVPYTVKQLTLLTANSELLNESYITNSFVDLTSAAGKRYFHKVDKVLNIDHLSGTASENNNTYDNYGNVITNVVKTGTLSGNTVNAVETTTTSTGYGTYNTPVPAKPYNISVTKSRSGASSQTVTTEISYTGNGLVLSKIEFAGLPKAVTTNFNYNSYGNATVVTTTANSLANRVTNFGYDAKSRFVVSKQYVGTNISQTEYSNYDNTGNLLSTTSIDCLPSTFEYDGFGRLKKTTTPEGYDIITSLHWDVQNENVYYQLTDFPGGKPDVKTWYDKLGRESKKQVLSFNNEWLTQQTHYNSKGQVSSKTNLYFSNETPFTTSNTYDAYNRLQSVVTPLNTVTYIYSTLSGGRLQVETQDNTGQTSTKISDAAGKIISAIDKGGTLDFTYDSWGNQTETKHGNTVVVSSTYDSYGRQTALVDKNAGTVTYQYDAFGQLTQQTDNNNNSYIMS
ncbi:MAG TPA: hypothetical protein VM368_00155, partial [Flavisolibacter sp.]|nr:hypothetical protein [Flavisolibacter sp.]